MTCLFCCLEQVAYVGKVPVKLRGPFRRDDFIVPVRIQASDSPLQACVIMV